MDGHDNNSGRKTGRRSYTFPSKGSRSNVSPRDKLIKKKKSKYVREFFNSLAALPASTPIYRNRRPSLNRFCFALTLTKINEKREIAKYLVRQNIKKIQRD